MNIIALYTPTPFSSRLPACPSEKMSETENKNIFSDIELFGVRTIETEIYMPSSTPDAIVRIMMEGAVDIARMLMNAGESLRHKYEIACSSTVEVTETPASLKFKMTLISGNKRLSDDDLRLFNETVGLLKSYSR